MIVTEEEAKTKRCQEGFGPMPQATVTWGPAYPVSHHGDGMQQSYWPPTTGTAPINCIGSACMAWRWKGDQPEIEIFVAGEDDAAFAKRRDYILGKRLGYCGKAGPA